MFVKLLLILNDAPYGIERTYNALRLAGALAKRPQVELRVFLMGDAVVAAQAGQKVPSGYYNAQTMLSNVLRNGAEVHVCGTCMDARGLSEPNLIESARRGTMDELAGWVEEADKLLNF